MTPAAAHRRWREQARRLRREVYALYLATRHPRVPWYAKALAAVTVAYALSPIDLIPDFIPVLGQLDDVLVVVLVLRWLFRSVEPEVLREAQRPGGWRTT